MELDCEWQTDCQQHGQIQRSHDGAQPSNTARSGGIGAL